MVAGLIKQNKESGDLIKKFLADFKKHDKSRKTEQYKNRRLDALKQEWDNFILLDEQICDKQGDDQDYVDYRDEIENVYKDYQRELMMLSSTDDEQNSSKRSSTSDDGTMEKQLNIQDVRFDKLKKIIEQINTKLVNEEKLSKSYISLKIKSLSIYWERISITNEELGSFGEPLEDEYEEKFNDCEAEYEEMLLLLQESLETLNENNEGIKMPRVVIPKFFGDYFEWVTFRDLFESMVVDNKKMAKAQKMQLLKTSVDGEAKGLISDLTISDVNFESAWNRLKKRYRVVVSQHLRKLVTQAPLKNDGTDSKALKKLLDTTDQVLLALKNLNRPVEHWDDWIVLTITHKLNDDLKRDWEKKIGNSEELPTWESLKKFLEEEFRISESVESGSRGRANPNTIKSNQVSMDHKQNCLIYKKQHSIFKCPNFRKMKPEERSALAKKEKLCYKCLIKHEDSLSCNREIICKKCNRKHNTWLHKGESDPQNKVTAVATIQTENKAMVASTVEIIKNQPKVSMTITSNRQTLLATAIIAIYTSYGEKLLFRALMDSGSQGSFIRKSAMELLQIIPTHSDESILPLGSSAKKAPLKVTVTIKPRFYSTTELEVDCYVLPRLTRTLPDENLNIESWTHLKELTLADPTFHKVGPIDLLLGMDVVADIMEQGLIRGQAGQPIAQQTALGWIVSGRVDPTYPRKEIRSLLAITDKETIDFKKFWELEELNPKRTMTPDEIKCEELYNNTVKKDEHGTYIVSIPFKNGKDGPEGLGSSRAACLSRFLQLEKRLQRDEKLRTDYVKVMQEYIRLGHLKVASHKPAHMKKYYIPHHGVVKMESLTTKLRVVFDASAKTTTGRSLNDTMYVGAKQQKDLLDILIKWRKYKIVFKADIEKMYRQIEMTKEDQQYHTIFWRNNIDEPLLEYQATVVVFGTGSAPYLATRTLQKEGKDNEIEYPIAAEIIKNDFYVDDLISGRGTIEEAIKAKDEVIASLKKGKFNLRKWSSNSSELLDSLPDELTERSLQSFEEEDSTKALGIQWNPKTDQFSFNVNWAIEDNKITKRKLLSEASKLFDPLGWLAPIIINAKLLMQKVWLAKLDWDDEVPADINKNWMQFRQELPMLKTLTINRWINYTPESEIQLIGFCDASEKAYAAVVYTRIQKDDEVVINLITSKTRVAPVKMKTTLPRLELCGSVLLSNLLTRTAEALVIPETQMYAWSDSTVTLGWLKGDPYRWKTFVANRVSEARANNIKEWNYVKSEENPADCSSRGIMPHELQHQELWWQGPKWLKNHPSTWDRMSIPTTDQETRSIVAAAAVVEPREELLQTSSWSKAVRIIAYCLRMKKGSCREAKLTLEELNSAKTALYKRCQQDEFSVEITKLQQNQAIPRNSKLKSLNAFLDENNLLRVGGRLENAMMSYENKHPIILPKKNQITKLIVKQMHLNTLHGGPQLMINLLRKKFWIIQAKRLCNDEYKKCVTCRRHKGKTQQQIMGQLPKDRVTLERAFRVSGVDYASSIIRGLRDHN